MTYYNNYYSVLIVTIKFYKHINHLRDENNKCSLQQLQLGVNTKINYKKSKKPDPAPSTSGKFMCHFVNVETIKSFVVNMHTKQLDY